MSTNKVKMKTPVAAGVGGFAPAAPGEGEGPDPLA
jgi:hypothetical protein